MEWNEASIELRDVTLRVGETRFCSRSEWRCVLTVASDGARECIQPACGGVRAGAGLTLEEGLRRGRGSNMPGRFEVVPSSNGDGGGGLCAYR
jgi:hypothetical protein